MITRLPCMFLLAAFLFGCDQPQPPNYTPTFYNSPSDVNKTYIFGVHPLHNPQRLFETFGPLMAYLSDNINGVNFTLEASRSYAAYDKKLYAKQFDFALPNPYQTINAIDKGYRVFAKMADDENFRGIILVRKDSNINNIADLKGKAVSYPAPTALAATIMPQYYLQTNGIDVMNELDNRYVGSQESSIMNVFLGQTAAAATWPPPWLALSKERPELKKQLEIKWQTEPLLNNALVVLPSINKQLVKQVTQLLLQLHQDPDGQAILVKMQLSKFEQANNHSYQAVRAFIKEFSEKVRPLN